MENKIKTSEFTMSMENYKDFDITSIDVKTYYDRLIGCICKVIGICEGDEIKTSDMELYSISDVNSQILVDGKEYPIVRFIVRKKSLNHGVYRVNITPFTMTIDGIIPSNKCHEKELTVKVLTKAVKDVHSEMFGDKFETAFKTYHQFVKNIKIKAVEAAKDKELNELEEMYEALL